LDRCRQIAEGRKESIASEIEKSISDRAKEIWAK